VHHIQVSYPDLVAAEEPGDDWLTYGGAYGSNRHSSLAQINTRNVSLLGVRWMHQLVGVRDKIETTPIVRDGVMYFTVAPGRIMAVDAASGRMIWEQIHKYTYIGGGEGPLEQNRGVALLGDRVFVGTWDSKLLALSAATGKVLWEAAVGEYPGTYVSGAPLVFHDLVMGFCLRHGFTPRVAQEANQTHTVVGLVSASIGVALVPESTQKIGLAGVAYRPLRERTPASETALAWRRLDASPVVKAFRDVARRVAKHVNSGRSTPDRIP